MKNIIATKLGCQRDCKSDHRISKVPTMNFGVCRFATHKSYPFIQAGFPITREAQDILLRDDTVLAQLPSYPASCAAHGSWDVPPIHDAKDQFWFPIAKPLSKGSNGFSDHTFHIHDASDNLGVSYMFNRGSLLTFTFLCCWLGGDFNIIFSV